MIFLIPWFCNTETYRDVYSESSEPMPTSGTTVSPFKVSKCVAYKGITRLPDLFDSTCAKPSD